MVVEDDPLLLAMAARVLKATGYQVIEAANGTAALDLAMTSQERIDLIVCDVVLPDIAGPEMVRQARLFRDDFKVLYTSGRSVEAVDAALNDVDRGHGERFLAKPYDPTDLVLRVQARLGESEF